MTTSTQPPGGPCAADWSQRRRRRGAGLPLRTPGLPPRAHCPHRGPPAEGGRELPEAGRSQGFLHRCGHGLPRGARARGAVCAGQAGRAGLPRAEPPRLRPGRHAGPERPSHTLALAGELPELRAADFAGAAQPDRQQGLPGGGVLAARPRAHVLLQPLFGRQVRAGRLLRLPAAGAGRAGRERGHHHVRPGPPGPRRGRGGSQGRHEGQGGPGAQGGPGGDPRRRHARLGRLLPLAFPPALPAPGVAAAPQGLVHPPGAQRHRRPRCCLSSWGLPLHPPGERPSIHPARRSRHLREGGHGPRQSSRQRRKTERNFQRLETVTTLGV
ncbi:hydroxysteroid 11-beta-dehydrogenase 1-like protein isoform X3 [Diceros bicornis minor]|uniref:hydroxysteroid 11-beta-dehydrogenase 1-like protein isoform X3 n=1 Tax=Diceros bicornis minor TaxID=77932 RepID=UPI0026F019AD|nr:hydroxysteroid 11-beta-dehydrogenase 1-like protein isoform X3 [Diceros bicornis minor]